jgi:hypothetical protein
MKPVEELTEEEKFTICLLAGVPIVSDYDHKTGKLKMTTAYPCGIYISEGRYHVVTKPNEENKNERKRIQQETY